VAVARGALGGGDVAGGPVDVGAFGQGRLNRLNELKG
jgi:hypothetical protein